MNSSISVKLHTDLYNNKYRKKYIFKIKNDVKEDEFIFSRLISYSIDKLYCNICFESKESWVNINKCNHKLCFDCFQKIIINSDNPIYFNDFIKCPFCRIEYYVFDTSHYIKSKLTLKVWDVVYKNKCICIQKKIK